MVTGGDAGDDAWQVTERALLAVFTGDADAELRRLGAPVAAQRTGDRALREVAATIAAVAACRFDEAAEHGAAALEAAEGCRTPVRRLAAAAALTADAMSGTAHAARSGITVPGVATLLAEPGRGALLTRYLLAEAALSSGAFDAAQQLVDGSGLAPGQASATREGPVDGAALALQLLSARSNAFHARVADVRRIQQGLARYDDRIPPRVETVLRAIECYGAALASDRDRFSALAELVLARARADRNYLSVGACLYVAWAFRAAGQLQRSASLLVATAGADLSRCKIWDRAFAAELLVEAALERGDRYRAGLIARQAAPLVRHVVAASSVTRTQGALAVSAGRLAEAEALALASIRLDEAAGAISEVQRGRMMQARALSASDPVAAAALLERVAVASQAVGNEAMRATAARRWRELSPRLPSAVGGVALLTPRQREVAVLVTEGHSNEAIAQALFVSPRTVQSHVADILRFTGARSRAEIAAALARPVGDELAVLTARQRQIAHLIARGSRNAEIAAELGVSEKTVENHVSALMDRLGVRSRAAVAGLAAGARPSDDVS
ncbi:LuxR C-terminal-related transcriptional regulator [Microbacterium sp. SORGH_AS_0888]|uniref:LuxR C-terminal-related transcriptional regulator n=1 Tax=Microbacterium sp. SORGH_AS_0888 TaxID=3041791 RepID=UPI002783F9B1|nr:LuxR C-terminal-related transcriptional regulator [Microbacterium sp. SORGH_AS_0888]MDQ1129441.1 DNA-binding NarL/FixJ family response regulator [Microbacterium sp. SORGH_AS_0888]